MTGGLDRRHVEPLMHFLLFALRVSDSSTRKYPFVTWEDLRKETVVPGLAFEEFGGELLGVTSPAVQENYCVHVDHSRRNNV